MKNSNNEEKSVVKYVILKYKLIHSIPSDSVDMLKTELFCLSGSSDKSNPVNRFDFLFLLRLRYADKKSSLAELIVAQHEKLELNDIIYIEAIIKGKTECSVLVM